MRGHVETLKLLLELGEDVNDPGPNPVAFLPLHDAVKYQHLEALKILMVLGADLGLKE